jgi:hypothetical protein
MKNLRAVGIAVHSSRQVRQGNFTRRSFCFVCFTHPQCALSIVAGSERPISRKARSGRQRSDSWTGCGCDTSRDGSSRRRSPGTCVRRGLLAASNARDMS